VSVAVALVVLTLLQGRDAAAPQQRPETPPAAPAAPPAPAGQEPPRAAAPAAPPTLQMVRLADPVAFLDGQARREDMLFFWDKFRPVRVGDGIRQGVAGISELTIAGSAAVAVVRSFGGTHLLVEKIEQGRVWLDVRRFSRMLCIVDAEELVLNLPSQYELRATRTTFQLHWDDLGRRMVIENAGVGVVRIQGPIEPLDVSTLDAGDKVEITMHVPASPQAAEERLIAIEHEEAWAGRTILLGRGVESTKQEQDLVLAGAGTAWVGGARIVMRGRQLIVRDPNPVSAPAGN
jgi:hypothetical protein